MDETRTEHLQEVLPMGAIGLVQAEYSALKAEQATRILVRDNALYSVLLVIAGIVTLALAGSQGRILLLLAVPPSIACLTVIYVGQDVMITRIRRYVDQRLRGLVIGAIGGDMEEQQRTALWGQLFAWEAAHRAPDPWRAARKVILLALLAVVLVGASAVCLLTVRQAAFALGGWAWWSWWFGALLALLTLVAVLSTADF